MAMTVSKVIPNNITTKTNYIVSNSFPFHQVHFIESEGGRSESRKEKKKAWEFINIINLEFIHM